MKLFLSGPLEGTRNDRRALGTREEIYDAALDLDEPKRAAFLESSCADDPELRREVESLLAHGEEAGDFLELPAMDVVDVPGTPNESGPLAEGTRLGPYQIAGLLGKGGMGEVYDGTDTRLDRHVAIKILPEHLAADPQRRERFLREARAVSSLNHPHICKLFDVGEQDGIHYLVMERVEGETLAARLEKGKVPLDQALEYAIQIADALDKAHRQGVVHRDLKPANIMATKSGTKLLDFGLARLGVGAPTTELTEVATKDVSVPLTAEGAIIGTLQYMAPEQLEGRETDARTDVFAFGALVYELVTGRRAFSGEGQASLIGAILKDEPGPMANFTTVTPASLDHVIGRCLRKDPDQRWQTAGDLMYELRWVREAKPAALEGPEPESRRGLFAVALATLAAGALITAVAMGISSPAPADEVTRLTLSVDEGVHLDSRNPGLDGTFGRPMRSAIALSPDGQNLVYVGYPEGADPQLYLRPLDQGQAHPIQGTEGARVASFSSDGQSIGFVRSEELMWVPVDGGEARTISITGPEFVPDAGLTWTDDDTILLASHEGVLEVAASGGVVTNLTSPDLASDYFQGYAQVLPGRNAVLYAEGPLSRGVPSEEFNVIVESLETGVPKVVVEGGTDPTYIDSGHIVFVRSGKLMAVHFDRTSLEAVGEPVVVLEDVMQTEGVGILGDAAGIGQYSVSASGTLVYLTGGLMPLQATRLNWVDLDGSVEPFLTQPRRDGTQPPTRYSHARFSPDGTRVAYTDESDRIDRSMWVYDMSLGSALRLAQTSLEHGSFAWSPEGTEIVFSARLGGGPMNLYRRAADGSGEPERLTQSDADQEPWSWSPDGVVAFVESGDIMTLEMDGENEPAPFHETPFFDESHPTFSPDGKWLAYTSNKSGPSEVYVRPYPAVEPPHKISSDGGQSPRWSPNGNKLFYRDPATDRIMVVDIPEGSISERGRSRVLFELEGQSVDGFYDVSPDGTRFVMGTRVARESENARRIHIVLNWVEALKALVPVP